MILFEEVRKKTIESLNSLKEGDDFIYFANKSGGFRHLGHSSRVFDMRVYFKMLEILMKKIKE